MQLHSRSRRCLMCYASRCQCFPSQCSCLRPVAGVRIPNYFLIGFYDGLHAFYSVDYFLLRQSPEPFDFDLSVDETPDDSDIEVVPSDYSLLSDEEVLILLSVDGSALNSSGVEYDNLTEAECDAGMHEGTTIRCRFCPSHTSEQSSSDPGEGQSSENRLGTSQGFEAQAQLPTQPDPVPGTSRDDGEDRPHMEDLTIDVEEEEEAPPHPGNASSLRGGGRDRADQKSQGGQRCQAEDPQGPGDDRRDPNGDIPLRRNGTGTSGTQHDGNGELFDRKLHRCQEE